MILAIAVPRSALISEAKGAAAQFLPQHGGKDRHELGFELHFGSGALHHPYRIDDAVTGIGIDLQALLVVGQHLLPGHVEIEHPPIDQLHHFNEGDAELHPCTGLAVRHLGLELVEHHGPAARSGSPRPDGFPARQPYC